jgi:hypothetical protein
MKHLPITRMTLYKHGVGFFERRAELSGDHVELSFRVEEMNDILKSLTAIDWGGGQVLGIDYATPQSREEQLAGCSIRLAEGRSFRDLLANLRGRRVCLLLEQEERAAGTLLGLDEDQDRQARAMPQSPAPLLVSLLLDETDQVQKMRLEQVQGVEVLDESAANDLRFFLRTALAQDEYRQVMIRLTTGQHDLSVSYIAPAPTWRVSYRLVVEQDTGQADGGGRRALLLGWGIFDNRMEEDLEAVSLSLVAGMPISFVYDLYTPFTPERPMVEEEARVAAAPVEYGPALDRDALRSMAVMDEPSAAMAKEAALAPSTARRVITRNAMAQAVPVTSTGKELGELFQYVIATPVTVARGQSAMVPIVSSDLECRKDLLYNGTKLPRNPVATIRLKNETGLTLERGPVTVIESGEYVGEALLPFTALGGEVVVPHAVELGIKVQEERGTSRQVRGLQVHGGYLHIEEWDVRWCEYQVTNSTDTVEKVLVEHPRTASYDLFDTQTPEEMTEDHYRFEVSVPPGVQSKLRIQERHLVRRREELRRQSYQGLQRFLRQGLIDQQTQARVAELLALWEQVADHEEAIKRTEQERQKLYKAQQQIQGNMGALSTTGKEGALRARYVDQLEDSEDRLRTLDGRESDLKAKIEGLKREIENRLQAFDQTGPES